MFAARIFPGPSIDLAPFFSLDVETGVCSVPVRYRAKAIKTVPFTPEVAKSFAQGLPQDHLILPLNTTGLSSSARVAINRRKQLFDFIVEQRDHKLVVRHDWKSKNIQNGSGVYQSIFFTEPASVDFHLLGSLFSSQPNALSTLLKIILTDEDFEALHAIGNVFFSIEQSAQVFSLVSPDQTRKLGFYCLLQRLLRLFPTGELLGDLPEQLAKNIEDPSKKILNSFVPIADFLSDPACLDLSELRNLSVKIDWNNGNPQIVWRNRREIPKVHSPIPIANEFFGMYFSALFLDDYLDEAFMTRDNTIRNGLFSFNGGTTLDFLEPGHTALEEIEGAQMVFQAWAEHLNDAANTNS